MRITRYEDLMAQYENPIAHACDMEVGQVFIANGGGKPGGFCQSAWDTPSPAMASKTFSVFPWWRE